MNLPLLSCRPAARMQRPPTCPVLAGWPNRYLVITAPARANRVGALRRRLAALLTDWGIIAEDVDSAVLVADELLANSAVHGRSRMELAVGLDRRGLRIAVTDYGKPQRTQKDTDSYDADEHGRGMTIVTTLTTHSIIHQGPWGRCICVIMSGIRTPPLA
ncbi:ATP-binding protein [Actinacidiphila glaucinigra]|uniref:ATP-binding protein n=1 Tax=Actinacidiphila glaucinigra TaxID=235986 RepID=UPI0037218E16